MYSDIVDRFTLSFCGDVVLNVTLRLTRFGRDGREERVAADFKAIFR